MRRGQRCVIAGEGIRGGNIFWGRKEESGFKGIVVIFSWVSVKEDQLWDFVDLFSSLGWNSLVCHAHYTSA